MSGFRRMMYLLDSPTEPVFAREPGPDPDVIYRETGGSPWYVAVFREVYERSSKGNYETVLGQYTVTTIGRFTTISEEQLHPWFRLNELRIIERPPVYPTAQKEFCAIPNEVFAQGGNYLDVRAWADDYFGKLEYTWIFL